MSALKARNLLLSCFTALLIFSVFSDTARAQIAGDYHTFGILGGFSFPKTLAAKLQLNFAEHWDINYEPSIGIFWTIQQGDLDYFFWRSDWSPYIGAGMQKWNFTGYNASTNFNGVPFSSDNATAVTFPLGLQYVADSGFALDLVIGADIFVDAPLDLKGKVLPEGSILLGYFF